MPLKQVRAFLEQSIDAVVVVDERGVVLYMNRVAQKIFGKSTSTFIEQVFKFPVNVGEMARVSFKDGANQEVVGDIRSISIEWEKAPAQLVTIRDITEHVHALQDLRVANERIELAVRGSRDAIWDWNILTNEVYYSQRYKEILGLLNDEISPHFSEFDGRLHADDREAVHKAIEHHLRSNDPFDIEFRLQTKKGEYKWFHSRGQKFLDNEGNPVRMSGSITEITEQKNTQAELKQAHWFLDSIVENIPLMLCVSSVEDLRIKLWNKTSEQISGVSRAQMLGKTGFESHLSLGMQPLKKEDSQTLTNNEILEYEEKLCSPYGERILSTRKVPIVDENGRLKYILGISEDITARKVAEEKLRQHIRALESIQEGVVITDPHQPDNPAIYCNGAYRTITGYSSEETLGKNCRFLQGTDRNQPEIAEVRSAIEEGRTCRVTLRNYRKDGTVFYNDLTVAPVFDDNHTLTHFVGTQNDITARKKVEQALEESNRLNLAILSSANHIIVATDPQGNILHYNKQAEISLGYKASEIPCGQALCFWCDSKEVERRAAELRNEHKVDIGSDFNVFIQKAIVDDSETREWTFVRKDGRRFPVKLSVTPIKNGEDQIVGFLSIGEDITEQKRQQDALKSSEETFRVAMEYAPVGMALVSLEGRWLKVNNALCKLLGYSVEEFLRGNFQTITHPEDLTLSEESRKKLISGELQSYEHEKRYFHKEGHIIWVLLSVSLIRNADGAPKYFISQLQDITGRKEIERMKSEFISVVSHELRTPLTSIRGSLGLIDGMFSKNLPHDLARLVSIAYRNSERLMLLVNDILDLDKIAAGQMTFVMKQENLPEIIQQAVEANHAYGEKYRVTFVVDRLPSHLDVMVDINRFTQAVTNLLSNAAKFSPEGERVRIYLKNGNGVVRVCIEDKGPGIPEEFRSRIFSRFAQGDASASRKRGGTGLGLYISKQIIERMGGKIGFDSEVGQGSTFWFELPTLENGLTKYEQQTESHIMH